MKVILNQDVANLGEMGDIKNVAAGYARNYLLPRGLAMPSNARSLALFEQKKAEIEAHKAEKRKASASLKDKIEAEELSLTMPAGANGKLFGAVSSQTIADALNGKNIVIDRKKIDVPDKVLKSTGNYKVVIHLYEKEEATLKVVIIGQETKKEAPAHEPRRSHRRDVQTEAVVAEAPAATAEAASGDAE